jgi:hypothetical protein
MEFLVPVLRPKIYFVNAHTTERSLMELNATVTFQLPAGTAKMQVS